MFDWEKKGKRIRLETRWARGEDNHGLEHFILERLFAPNSSAACRERNTLTRSDERFVRTARTRVIASTATRASGVRPTGTSAGRRRVSTADCARTAWPTTTVRVPTVTRVQ